MKNSRPEGGQLPFIAHANRLLSRCSLACLRRLAVPIAGIAKLTDNQLRRAARDNLQLVYPHRPAEEREKMLKDILFNTACALTETAFIWHRPMDQVLAQVTEEEICEGFLDSQRPKLVVAPHLGNWEFLNLWLSARMPLLSLYKPARDPKLDCYIRVSRSRNQAELVPTNTGGLRQLIRGMRAGKSCMVLPDQKPGRDRGKVESEFFGLTVDSSTLVQQLSRRVICDPFIAAAVRDFDKDGFRIIVRPLDRERLSDEELHASRYLNQSIEQLASDYPEQYQWVYRRFRNSDYRIVETARNSRCR